MIAIIGLLVGIAVGILWGPVVPVWLEPYLPIAIVAALDAVFGGFRALMEKRFDDRIFVETFERHRNRGAGIGGLGDDRQVLGHPVVDLIVAVLRHRAQQRCEQLRHARGRRGRAACRAAPPEPGIRRGDVMRAWPRAPVSC